jgi:hypothetical protein
MKVSIEQTITNVNECMSSVFTKQDVLQLLANLEAKNIDVKKLAEVIEDHIMNTIQNVSSDEIVDYESAEFELSGNEIRLNDIMLNESGIRDNVTYDLTQIITDYIDNN